MTTDENKKLSTQSRHSRAQIRQASQYCKIGGEGEEFCAACMEGLDKQELERLRQAFPLLKESFYGKPFIYFNNASTALKPAVVWETMDDYYAHYGVNVFRGVDSISYRATQAFEEARKKVQQFIGAGRPEEVVFTRNTTEALNLVCRSYGELAVDKDSEIVVSAAEHHANYIPWQQLAKRKGAKLVLAPLTADGELTAENLESVMNERTKIVAVAQISNVMGALNNLPALAAVAHRYGAAIVVDGAQGIVHEKPAVREWDIDFFAFSGHKLYGPTGVGCLYGRWELLLKMPPVDFGGEMIDTVSKYDTTFADPPHRFEAGTPMIAEAIGLNRALDFVTEIGYEKMQRQVCHLAARLRDGLLALPDLTIYNPNNSASGIITFNIKGVHAHDAASVFDRAGISLRAGQHCNQPTMDWLCEAAVLRVSLAYFNTDDEVDYFIETAKKAGDFLDVLF